MREPYQVSKEELLSGVNLKTGLSSEEAKLNLEKYGENVLQ